MSKAVQFKNKTGEKIYPCPYYPVGSIYLSVNSTNPGSIFGGSWEQIKDRFLLACGNTYSNGSTGGEAKHTLTTSEMPSHTHAQRSRGATGDIAAAGSAIGAEFLGTSSNSIGNTFATGGGAAHNNMPPYLAVYVWKRVSVQSLVEILPKRRLAYCAWQSLTLLRNYHRKKESFIFV